MGVENGRDRHRCPTCRGTGEVILSGVYLETLEFVRRWCERHGFVVANRAATEAGCEATALNNRLARLESLGYLTSEQYGRQRRFRIAPAV